MQANVFKSKTSIILVLVILIIGAFYFGLAKLWQAYSLNKNQLKAVKAEQERLNKDVNQIQAFLEEFTRYESEVRLVSKALPAKELQTGQILASLDELAKTSGVVLETVSLLDSVEGTRTVPPLHSLQTQNLTIKASGNYVSFKVFLIRLENFLRLMDVSDFIFEQSETGEGNYMMDLKVYFQK